MTNQEWDELDRYIENYKEPSLEYRQTQTEIEYVERLIENCRRVFSVSKTMAMLAPKQHAASTDIIDRYEKRAAAEMKRLEFELKALELKLKTLKE